MRCPYLAAFICHLFFFQPFWLPALWGEGSAIGSAQRRRKTLTAVPSLPLQPQYSPTSKPVGLKQGHTSPSYSPVTPVPIKPLLAAGDFVCSRPLPPFEAQPSATHRLGPRRWEAIWERASFFYYYFFLGDFKGDEGEATSSEGRSHSPHTPLTLLGREASAPRSPRSPLTCQQRDRPLSVGLSVRLSAALFVGLSVRPASPTPCPAQPQSQPRLGRGGCDEPGPGAASSR